MKFIHLFLLSSHDIDCNDNEDGLETMKKAFSLMGYANLIEDESQRKLQGEVVYRKRNIRRQSFHLAELKRLKTKYKTTLDDAGTTRCTNKVISTYNYYYSIYILTRLNLYKF